MSAEAARARDWLRARSYRHADFTPERLAADRRATVSVCVPAREEAATIGAVVEALIGLRARGVVDQVVVVDAASNDGTADIAASAGAEVHQQDALMPSFGPARGKGDALWRALSVADGEVICFVDADSPDFGPHFACGLIGPLLADDSVEFVKGAYRRPFAASGDPSGGGRVTELMARPLLSRFYPELAGVRQPLAGEIAARRTLLERLPFSTGYAVEIALLLDAWREVGLDALAQVDLDVRHNRHQPLQELGPMASAVLGAVCERLAHEGRLDSAAAGPLLQPGPDGLTERITGVVERPPMKSVAAAA